MANSQEAEAEIKRLLKLSTKQLEDDLVSEAAKSGEFLQIAMQTEPPSSPAALQKDFRGFPREQQLQLVKGVFQRGRDNFKHTICVKLRYCERKGHDLVALLAAIAAVLCHMPPALAVGLLLAVYLYKNGELDELCGCK
jgi:hypothetical protein